MRTVWKYTIDLKESVNPTFSIPGGGHFLSLCDRKFDNNGMAAHPDKPLVDTWWAVDTDAPEVEVQLYVRGTGLEVPPSVNYLGTIFPLPGIVMHIWQKDRVFTDMEIVDGVFVPKSQ